jgi:Cof subfamily protein (haloacid dehalogenase superfamily)
MPPESSSVRSAALLVCDLDGTLLDGEGRITAATEDALRRIRSAGIELAIATGRRHSYALQVLAPLRLPADTVIISSNGGVTRSMGGETLCRINMPIATALALCRFGSFRESLVFTFDRSGPGSLIVENIAELALRLPRWVAANREEIVCFEPIESAFDAGEMPIQAMICGTVAQMAVAAAELAQDTPEATRLRQVISGHRTEYAARDLSVLDLMPHDCSKGAAVAALARQRGLTAEAVICVGDNMNDADMLAYAGRPLVMGNAHADLLEMAGRNGWSVIGSNHADGVAQALLDILQGE